MRTLSLSNVGRIVTGKTPPTADPANYGREIPFVTPSDMDGRRSIDHTLRCLSEAGARVVRSSRVQGPAVVVSCIGSDMGKAAVVWGEFVTNQQINTIIPHDGVDPLYVYYNLSARRAEIRNLAGGAAQPIMNKSAFSALPITLPDFGQQVAIGRVLGALDDKIELNRRMNDTLEAIAQAIFRDWFVDFGPTRRKLAGVTDPVEIMGGLVADPVRAAELAGSQPADFSDEECPVGWGVRPLSELTTELRRGIGPKYVEQDGVLVLNQKCIRNREVSFGPARRHDDTAKGVAGRTLVNGDVLVNSTGVGTLGRVAQIWGLDQRVIVDSHVTVVRASSTDFSSIYLGLSLGLREEEIVALGEGSTGQTELSREQLGRMVMVVPSKIVLDQFDAICTPLVERIQANRQEATTLAETRDYLLPRLMSGEVSVGRAVEGIPA